MNSLPFQIQTKQPESAFAMSESADDYGMDDGYDEIFNSPSLDDSFQHATLIATLAERFGITSFRPYQKDVIKATLDGRDTLVIQPTGSGKSLCFQFIPVYLNKKAIIVTPTISLMQDQVFKLNSIGIPSVFVGSAQLDKFAENNALNPDSDVAVIFVTPEWITKPTNQTKMHSLIQADKLSLIAIDEAHLYTEWNKFRDAFNDLRKLKSDFPSIPIMALTATATPHVEEDIKLLLRDPVKCVSSMNRPNVTLKVEELVDDKQCLPVVQFAKRAAEIVGSNCSIIYTDFISDIGPIISGLQECGLDAVGYHGEMDFPSRQQSYIKWKTGEVNTIVATKAFGMGIDKPDIRFVVRNGVPESMLSWAQELGRAGRDGGQANAIILYRKSDIKHANAWVLNNVKDKSKCSHILSNFSESWKFVNAHLAGKCRRRILLDMFGETETTPEATGDCCDICMITNDISYANFKDELAVLIDALKVVGSKGEYKIAEWIRGSKIPWTNAYNKKCLSYGNHKGRDFVFWRNFIKQCHVLSLVKLELKSMIKKDNTWYAVNGVYYPTRKGIEACDTGAPTILPISDRKQTSRSNTRELNDDKKKRVGKGSNILTIVRQLLAESENWMIVNDDKNCYHYPGVFQNEVIQQLWYVQDIYALQQSCEDPHYIWKDIQLSKGQLNKDRLITVDLDGKKEELYFRSAPCLGVKYCTETNCTHIVPIRNKRNCPTHNKVLQKSGECPVEFVYIHPKNSADGRRWFGGIVRCQKLPSNNLHNHNIHGANKISQCVREKISKAITANPTLTPTEIACGKGIGFIPSAIDDASCHTGKVSEEIRKTKKKQGLLDKFWSPTDFENVAESIDQEDYEAGTTKHELDKYKRHGRPYLVSAGIENGIKFVFTMSPLMADVASRADFIQCDITYDNCKDYPYIFNAVAFDTVSMEWIVVARLRLSTQGSTGYALSFKKIFDECKNKNHDFGLLHTLQGIVTDWSDAEISGLKCAVGKESAEKLLKGCKVHWQRSCQRVADKVISSRNRVREKTIFMKISGQIQKLDSSVSIIACFEALCGVRSVTQLLDVVPGVCESDDAKFVDENCNWASAKHWAQWWCRCDHLRMLSKCFSLMEEDTWKRCPSTTNAVERRNKDCKGDTPGHLKLAMIKVYKIDKVACLKHMAAEKGVSLSYRSRTEDARRMSAAKKQQQRLNKVVPDKNLQFGPPDRNDTFACSPPSKAQKRSHNDDPCCSSIETAPKRIKVNEKTVECIPSTNPDILGRRAKMKFDEGGEDVWYEGIISSYNVISGKYGIYFPSDDQTEEASLDDEDLEIMEH